MKRPRYVERGAWKRFLFRFLLLRARLHVWNALVSLSVECKLKTWWTTDRQRKEIKVEALSLLSRHNNNRASETLFPPFALSFAFEKKWKKTVDCTEKANHCMRQSRDSPRESFSVSFIAIDLPREMRSGNRGNQPRTNHRHCWGGVQTDTDRERFRQSPLLHISRQ